MSAFWLDWTEEEYKFHRKQGWTVGKLVEAYKFKKGQNEEIYQTYFLNDLADFLAQGNYIGNYMLHDKILLPVPNDWGRRDWTMDPHDPVGFMLDFRIYKDYFISQYGEAEYKSEEFINDFKVLKLIWKKEYIAGYESLGYLTGQKLFLDTIYWNVIRLYLIHTRGYKCELCGGPGYMAVSCVLEVHHNHYRVHGIEHLCLDTLSIVHRECHQRLHPEGQNPYIQYR